MTAAEKNIINRIKNQVAQKDPSAELILFGSRARGDAGKNSDWDILILLNAPGVSRSTEKAFRDEIFEVELETGQPISTFVFAKNEWETKHAATPLYKNIQQEGIKL